MHSASELEASCTKTLGRSCMPPCMKDTAALDRKGADCCGLSDILMCELNEAISCSLAVFVAGWSYFWNSISNKQIHDDGQQNIKMHENPRTCGVVDLGFII